MQGKRSTSPPHLLNPGEWVKVEGGFYYAKTPTGMLCNLRGHAIEEHDDGTISASPSIMVSGGYTDRWHGHLKRGVWTEC